MSHSSSASREEIARAKALVRDSFGAVAANYRRSPRHGDPRALRRMLELLEPKGDERVLDVATGGGHTAAALGPFVRHVVASDLLPEMLAEAASLFNEAELSNVQLVCADVHDLPFATGSFDIVTCRSAPHHFADFPRACSEIARSLRAEGRFYVYDCGVPQDTTVAEFVNEVERLRDPSHVKAYSASEWESALSDAGFEVRMVRELPHTYYLQEWLGDLRVPDERRARVFARLAAPPAGFEGHVAIDLTPGQEVFSTLRIEALAVARRC